MQEGRTVRLVAGGRTNRLTNSIQEQLRLCSCGNGILEECVVLVCVCVCACACTRVCIPMYSYTCLCIVDELNRCTARHAHTCMIIDMMISCIKTLTSLLWRRRATRWL